MLTTILFFMLMTFVSLPAMEQMEVDKEFAYTMTPLQLKEETIDPALLTLISLPQTLPEASLDALFNYPLDELPIKRRNRPTQTLLYDFPLGGKTCAMHFSLSSKERQKSRSRLTNWFNETLDLISSRAPKGRFPWALVVSFSTRTGKVRYEKPYEYERKIHKKITKETVQKWSILKKSQKKRRRKK